MRCIYFDCFSGASGDMIVASLLDAGLTLETLRDELGRLKLTGYHIRARRVKRRGIAGTKFDVIIKTHEHEHRHLHDVLDIIRRSTLSDRVKHDVEGVFRRLAQAEAAVHGITVEKATFHEVGAVDSIVDVVAAAAGLEKLGIVRVAVSPLVTGSGFVECQHGRFPVPAPAVAELLKGFPIACGEIEMELTTPTGAAILTTLGESFGKMPSMTVESVGYGAGTRDPGEMPNLLRVVIGETQVQVESDRVWVLETNIDDMPPELFEVLFEKLFAAGVLDVFTTAIQMKKGRPAVKLSVIAPEELRSRAEEIIFRETTTFGIRAYEVERRKLERESVRVRTKFGLVGVKLGRMGGELLTASPEYEDCRRAAARHGVALKEVYEEAKRAAHDLTSSVGTAIPAGRSRTCSRRRKKH
jgi:hypothetical protein